MRRRAPIPEPLADFLAAAEVGPPVETVSIPAAKRARRRIDIVAAYSAAQVRETQAAAQAWRWNRTPPTTPSAFG